MEVVQPLIQYGVPSLAVLKMVHDVTGHSATPMTGYQYAKAGGEQLDDALDILTGPRGINLGDKMRKEFLETSDVLVPIRHDVDKKTRSYKGSIWHRAAAKEFYELADKLHGDTQRSSHKANIDKSLQDINYRADAERRESWEQAENQLRARMDQIEEEAMAMTLSPSHNTFPQDGSQQAPTLVENPSDQALVYPPAVYHPANSTRC